MNTAQLIIKNQLGVPVQFFWQYKECYQCLYFDGVSLGPGESHEQSIDTRYGTRYAFVRPGDTTSKFTAFCESEENFSENWVYSVPLKTSTLDNIVCGSEAVQTAPNSNAPVYVALAIFVILAALWAVYLKFEERIFAALRNYKARFDNSNRYGVIAAESRTELSAANVAGTSSGGVGADNTAGSSVSLPVTNPAPKRTSSRLNSLDSFRGLVLCLMIFVNYGGGSYFYFNHIDWNGITFADLVFPGFVFIMGVTMSLTLRRSLNSGKRNQPKRAEQPAGDSNSIVNQSAQSTSSCDQCELEPHTSWLERGRMLLRMIRRSATLFLLGFSLSNEGQPPAQWRILGVLQRFGLTYLIVGMVTLLQIDEYPMVFDPLRAYRYKLAFLRDFYPFYGEWIVMSVIVFIYLALTFLLPVPGCPTGYLGPGGLSDEGKHAACTGGAAGYIDRSLFGDAHVYQYPTCRGLYGTTVPYDPEGSLGTLSTALLCYLGLQVGKIMFTYRHDLRSMYSRWILLAVVTGAVALGLCGAQVNGGVIPLNKNLWSLSYVLAMASVCTLVFGLFFFLIDHWHVWHGEPFTFIGQNSILIYCAHEVFQPFFPVTFGLSVTTHAEALALNIYSVVFWVFVSYVLYRKRIFLTI